MRIPSIRAPSRPTTNAAPSSGPRSARNLYIWHYNVKFMHYYCPFPNFGALAADMRFYRDIGVEGVYLQGMSVEGGGGEFSLLRPYYAMKLLWDTGQDADSLLRDFLQGYYGAAWESLFAYIKLLQTKVDTENIHTHMYMNPAQGYLTDDILQQAMGLFDRADAGGPRRDFPHERAWVHYGARDGRKPRSTGHGPHRPECVLSPPIHQQPPPCRQYCAIPRRTRARHPRPRYRAKRHRL